MNALARFVFGMILAALVGCIDMQPQPGGGGGDSVSTGSETGGEAGGGSDMSATSGSSGNPSTSGTGGSSSTGSGQGGAVPCDPDTDMDYCQGMPPGESYTPPSAAFMQALETCTWLSDISDDMAQATLWQQGDGKWFAAFGPLMTPPPETSMSFNGFLVTNNSILFNANRPEEDYSCQGSFNQTEWSVHKQCFSPPGDEHYPGSTVNLYCM